MNAVILLAVCSAVLVVQAQEEDGFYDSRYDFIDVDTLLENKRLVRNYVNCLLHQKPCTAEGKVLRRILPEGLRTKCAKCSPRQKAVALAVLRKLRSDYPEEWARLVLHWDPSGDLTRRFETYLESEENNKIGYDKPTEVNTKTTISVQITTKNDTDLNMQVEIGNRFGLDEKEPSSSEIKPTIRSPMDTTTKTTTTKKATAKPYKSNATMKPVYVYVQPRPLIDLAQIYDGTRDLIDHFNNKIIKTTEIVTDLLKSTVQVVVGAGRN